MFLTFSIKRAITLIIFALATISVIYYIGTSTKSLADDDETVLIIDPGHGGEDGGAQTQDGVLESKINLDISLKLDALAGLYGIETAMTRDSAGIDYPNDAHSIANKKVADQKARVTLVNSYNDAILVSIHQNCFPDPRPFGCQVLYAQTDQSEHFGKLAHEMLCKSLCPDNRRVASPVPDSIYLMKNVSCTAILVECGFLSNTEEAKLLQAESYQKKISAVLLVSYLQFTAEYNGMV